MQNHKKLVILTLEINYGSLFLNDTFQINYYKRY